jgi:DNA primase
MYQSGITNSVGICGTAFSRNHMIRLSRYSDRITFIMDNDDAGEKAMQRIAKLFDNRGVILRFLKLPNKYKDIDEYLNVNDKSNLKNDLKNICFSVY